ncbi:hypothetical protein [Leifsonia sp. 22587]|uniref:hypothetical protein n=1 Tax=Leifsonia sp. 22587 TaxID=3453946 RepID=UPI003F86703E
MSISAGVSTSSTLRRLHEKAVEPGRAANADLIARHRSRDDLLERMRMYARRRVNAPVFCQSSALLIHGLPLLGTSPTAIHVLARAARDDHEHGIVTHARRDDAPVVEIRGLLVTTLAHTVVDVAASASLMDGVVVADAALAGRGRPGRMPRISRDDLAHAARSLAGGASGRARAQVVARFADGRAESPLESVSRVSMGLAGAPTPELQLEVEDLLGFRARVDFAWPDLGLVGEADGAVKYRQPAMRRERSSADIVSAHAERQRLIESMGLRVVRWGWPTGTRPDRMSAILTAAGVTLSPRCTIDGVDEPAVRGTDLRMQRGQ